MSGLVFIRFEFAFAHFGYRMVEGRRGKVEARSGSEHSRPEDSCWLGDTCYGLGLWGLQRLKSYQALCHGLQVGSSD